MKVKSDYRRNFFSNSSNWKEEAWKFYCDDHSSLSLQKLVRRASLDLQTQENIPNHEAAR